MPLLAPPPVTAAPLRVVKSFAFNAFVARFAFAFLAIVRSPVGVPTLDGSLLLTLDLGRVRDRNR
jgi:hypothetical protein